MISDNKLLVKMILSFGMMMFSCQLFAAAKSAHTSLPDSLASLKTSMGDLKVKLTTFSERLNVLKSQLGGGPAVKRLGTLTDTRVDEELNWSEGIVKFADILPSRLNPISSIISGVDAKLEDLSNKIKNGIIRSNQRYSLNLSNQKELQGWPSFGKFSNVNIVELNLSNCTGLDFYGAPKRWLTKTFMSHAVTGLPANIEVLNLTGWKNILGSDIDTIGGKAHLKEIILKDISKSLKEELDQKQFEQWTFKDDILKRVPQVNPQVATVTN